MNIHKRTLGTILFSLFLIFDKVCAQNGTITDYALTITPKELKEHVYILAADSMAGRATGTPGQHKAANYIVTNFEKLGLKPFKKADGYLQKVPLFTKQIKTYSITIGDKEFKALDDVLWVHYNSEETHYFENIKNWSLGDLNQLEILDGKKNVILRYENVMDLLSISKLVSETSIENVLLFSPQQDNYLRAAVNSLGGYLNRGRTSVILDEGLKNAAVVSPEVIEALTGNTLKSLEKRVSAKSILEFKRATIKVEIQAEVTRLEASNVLGFIPGADKPDEYLIITGHYDHLGQKDDFIYNGADDNASGTSTIIEIAEAFTEAKDNGEPTKRSIIFMLVTAEEMGLLGSQYYVEHPTVPLSQITANLNIDMIGRVDDAHKENPRYIYLIGSDKISQDLHDLSEEVNKRYLNYTLDYTFNDVNDPNRFYYRSDHYNFAKNGIPVIFYFSGVHKDYHQPSDTPEKLNYERMSEIGQLIFFTAWELANRDEPLNK